MKSCPNCRLTFADETYSFCLHDGSILTPIDEPEVETVISRRNFKIQPSQPSNNYSVIIDERIIAINIAQQYPYVKDESELYEVTRGLWRLSRQRAEKAEYAFAVFRKEIKEVYKIHRWESARFDINEFWVKRKREQGVEIDPAINEGRYQFVGKSAPDFVRVKYVGKQMPVAHAQNPIRYFNC